MCEMDEIAIQYALLYSPHRRVFLKKEEPLGTVFSGFFPVPSGEIMHNLSNDSV